MQSKSSEKKKDEIVDVNVLDPVHLKGVLGLGKCAKHLFNPLTPLRPKKKKMFWSTFLDRFSLSLSLSL